MASDKVGSGIRACQAVGDLGNDHGGLATVAVVKDFEQVSGLGGGQRVSEPVIEDEQMGTSQLGQQLRIGTISAGQLEGVQQARGALVTHIEFGLTGCPAQGTS